MKNNIPIVSCVNGVEAFPYAVGIARTVEVRKYVKKDPVAFELYGVIEIVFDRAAAESSFRAAYNRVSIELNRHEWASANEIAAALDVMEERAEKLA
jgi:hypothetical protein